MSALRTISAELLALFVDDGSLALGAIAWAAICYGAGRLGLAPLLVAVLLAAGLLALLAETVWRGARAKARRGA